MLPGGRYWMPLFVELAEGTALDGALRTRIETAIRTRCSSRHVPDEILEVPAIPHTLTGKRLEVPVKRLIQGFDPTKAVNTGVVDRPDVLELFVELGRARRARGARDGRPVVTILVLGASAHLGRTSSRACSPTGRRSAPPLATVTACGACCQRARRS